MAMNDQNSFEVTLARSGGTYVVPENQSIIDVLSKHGILVEVSCEQGVCGTCITGIVSGIPDHKDVYLSDHEKAAGDVMMPCVSRCKSGHLVLDL
jgi:vanillate O-demethylase ferredoxin subunit